MLTTVVFDVGETLVNERRLWSAWAEWLETPDYVFFAALGATIARGEHHHRVFEILRPGFDLEAAQRQRRVAGVPDEFTAADIYPDVAECLRALHGRGLRIGLAGNQPAGIEGLVRELALPVDFIGSSEEWGVEKPAPAFFERLAREIQAPPGSIAYVGDRLDNDVLPAVRAGLIGVFLRRGPWGFLHAARPEAAEAHLRIDKLGELADALDGLRV